MLLCWATSSITVCIAKKIVSPWPAGECRSDGPPLPVSRAGIGVALMPALQKAPAWSTFIFQISARVFKTRFPQKNRLKLAGRPPLLPLRSPVQSQTGIRVGVQQLFELGPNLEKGALSTVSVWLETNRVSRDGSNLRQ